MTQMWFSKFSVSPDESIVSYTSAYDPPNDGCQVCLHLFRSLRQNLHLLMEKEVKTAWAPWKAMESHGKPWFKRIFQKTPSYTHCISTSDLNKTPIPRCSAIRSISWQVKTLMLPPRQLKGGKSVKLRSQMGLVQPLFSRAKRVQLWYSSDTVDACWYMLMLCWYCC